MHMRKLMMFVAGFALMLGGGMASAQLAGRSASPPTPPPAAIATVATEPTTTTTAQKPTTTIPEEPSEEPTATTPTTGAPRDAAPPPMEILWPSNGQSFDHKEVVFEGRTEPGARVFAGEFQADVRGDGSWRIVLWLNPGKNVATLTAVDEAGNEASDSVTVIFDKPAEQPEGEHHEEGAGSDSKGDGRSKGDGESKGDGQSKTFEFSANQKFGSCDSNPPYDVFWGTGRPGLVIEIASEYGSARREVGEGGGWDARVEFPDAPIGVPFPVVIETSDGDRAEFTFTRVGGEETPT
jgi:hypothetical protein